MVFKFNVRGDRIRPLKDYEFVEGNRGSYEAFFDFEDGSEWDKVEKLCVVECGEKVYHRELDINGKCILPEMEKDCVRIGVLGVTKTAEGEEKDITPVLSTNMHKIGVIDGAASSDKNSELNTAAEVWQTYLADMGKFRDEAQDAAEDAEEAKDAAEKAAESASGSATAASGSALAASEAASAAQTAQTAAEEARDDAEEWARQADGSSGRAEAAAGAAYSYRGEAEGFKNEAQTAAESASGFASAASESASAAQTAQTAAEESKDSAASSASQAVSAKKGAETAQTIVQSKVTEAIEAAQSAESAAESASSSASAASESASAASESASAASESASAAEEAKTAAEEAAERAEENAEKYAESFDGLRYYGDANIVPSDASLFLAEIATGFSDRAEVWWNGSGSPPYDLIIPYQVEIEGNTYPVSTISEEAFYDTKILRVMLPNCVKYIEPHAFSESGLSELIFCGKEIEIAEYAFANCTNFKHIYYSGSKAEWEKFVEGKENIPENVTIHYEYAEEITDELNAALEEIIAIQEELMIPDGNEVAY